MSHKMLRPFIVKVSVLGYFPLYNYQGIIFINLLSWIILNSVYLHIIHVY